MKIRFYHWWIYKLYWKFWSPILSERPQMVNAIADHMIDWLEARRYDSSKLKFSSADELFEHLEKS